MQLFIKVLNDKKSQDSEIWLEDVLNVMDTVIHEIEEVLKGISYQSFVKREYNETIIIKF